MLIPPVSQYMTSRPHVVAPGDSLVVVREVMRTHGVQHVPVVASGQLVGLVTDRDVTGSYGADDAASDAMDPEVPTARPDAPLDVVVTLMQAGRGGCVVVVGADGVDGIFTHSDAMRALVDLFDRQRIQTPAPAQGPTERLMRTRGPHATRPRP